MTSSTTEFLQEQKRLAEAATPGPWHEDRFTNGLITACGRVDAHGDQLAVADSVYMLSDREFIAAARSSVPKLIAAVEAVMAQADALDEMAESPVGIGEVGSALRLAARSIRNAVNGALGDGGDE